MFENIVKIFRFARKSQNMTQAELAEKLHISDKAWSKIETGANQLEFQHIKPACDALNLPYLEILQEICPVLPDRQSVLQEYQDGRVTSVRYSGESEPEPDDWVYLFGPKMGAYLKALNEEIEDLRGGRWYDLVVTNSEKALMQVLADYAGMDVDDDAFGRWFMTLLQWQQMKGCAV